MLAASCLAFEFKSSKVNRLSELNATITPICLDNNETALPQFAQSTKQGCVEFCAIMASTMQFLTLHPFVRDTVHSKLLGTIIGSALGDTIGLYTEFLSAAVSETSYPLRRFSLIPTATPFRADGHRDRFASAAWTDDTDHALLLLLAYLHSKGDLDTLPLDFANRLALWSNQGLRCLDRPPLGIGKTVGQTARHPKFLSDPGAVALELWIRSGRRAAANGSLMRTHPLGVMALPLSQDEAFAQAARLSRTTHPDPRCLVACCAAVGLVRGIVRGEVRGESEVDAMLEAAFQYVATRPELCNPGTEDGDNHDDEAVEEVHDNELLSYAEFSEHVHAEQFVGLQLDDSMKMGYVYKCLGAGVLALRQAIRSTVAGLAFPPPIISASAAKDTPEPDKFSMGVFEDIITELTMCGGDADTNCCVAGAFIGAWVGYQGLPAHWVGGLAHKDWLLKKSERLSQLIGVMELDEDDQGNEDPDTAPDGGKPEMTREELEKRDADFVHDMLTRAAARNEKDRAIHKERGHGLVKWMKGAAGRKKE